MPDRVYCQYTRFSHILQVLFIVWGVGQDGAQGQLTEQQAANHYFIVRVVDRQTKRGVPLIELRTVNNIRYVTDSKGLARNNLDFWTPNRTPSSAASYVALRAMKDRSQSPNASV